MWYGVNPKVRNLLLLRFLFATCSCYYLEYKLLIIFLAYVRFDVFHPINFLTEVVSWTIYSIYTWRSLFLLMMIVFPYGILLCHMHLRYPTCHSSWQVYVKQEIPLKLSLLIVLMNSSYHSSWFYFSYLDEKDLSLSNQYILVSSLFCGFYHFVIEHCNLNTVVWSPPLRLQKIAPFYVYLMEWPNFWQAFKKVVLPIIILASLYSPSWQQFFQSCLLFTLITAQLNEIKRIYGEIMLRKLPLTLRDKTCFRNWEMELPMIVALSTTSLHGFQLQVAMDFSDIMCNTWCKECNNLFILDGFMVKHNKNWKLVLDILLGRITYFMRQLEIYLNFTKDTPVIEQHRDNSNMRPLISSPKPTRYYSRRACSPDYNTHSPRRQQTNQPKLKIAGWFKFLNILNKKWSSEDYLELELKNGLSFIWLIQGLVSICIRSLKDDTYGIIQDDLNLIFQVLIDLEKMLILAKQSQKDSSDSLIQLLTSTSRSINLLKYHFFPYFEIIIKDANLLKDLQSHL